MMMKTLLGALLLAGSFAVHAAGNDLDLGLCDKTPELAADKPAYSPVPKAKKISGTKAAADASASAPAKLLKPRSETAASLKLRLPPAH